MLFKLTLDGEEHKVSIARRRPHLVLLVDGEEHEVASIPAIGDGRHTLAIGGHTVSFARATAGDRQIVRMGGRTFDIGHVDPFSHGAGAGGGQNVLKVPMPGAVVGVHRRAGEAVRRGETVVTIESMKLQTALPAPRDGVIAQIRRDEGETFEKDEVIVTFEPEAGPEAKKV